MEMWQPRDEKGRFAPFVGTFGDDVFDALWNRMCIAALGVLAPKEKCIDAVTFQIIKKSTRRTAAELHRLAPLIGKKVRIANDER